LGITIERSSIIEEAEVAEAAVSLALVLVLVLVLLVASVAIDGSAVMIKEASR
jgi:hypothetical protein